MRSGRLADLAQIQRIGVAGDDGYGNVHQTWAEVAEAWVNITETTGRERIAAGAMQGPATAIVRARHSAALAAITAADRMIARGFTWAVVSPPIQIGDRERMLEWTVERGVAI